MSSFSDNALSQIPKNGLGFHVHKSQSQSLECLVSYLNSYEGLQILAVTLLKNVKNYLYKPQLHLGSQTTLYAVLEANFREIW